MSAVEATGIATKDVKYYFNNAQKLLPEGYATIMYSDRLYVPVRFIAEGIGQNVEWNDEDQSVSFTDTPVCRYDDYRKNEESEKNIDVSEIQVKYYFNNELKDMPADYKTLMYQDRIYVPIRFIAESAKTEIDWDEVSQSVYIKIAHCDFSYSDVYDYNEVKYIYNKNIDGDSELIKAFKNDGGNYVPKIICNGQNISIYGKYIYYQLMCGGDFYRCDLNGENEILIDDSISNFFIDKTGILYRIKSNADILYKSNIILGNQTKLDINYWIFDFIDSDKYLYYISDKDNNMSLIKMDSQLNTETKLIDLPKKIYGIQLVNDFVYYIDGEKGILYNYDLSRNLINTVYQNEDLSSLYYDNNNLYLDLWNNNYSTLLQIDLNNNVQTEIFKHQNHNIIGIKNDTIYCINDTEFYQIGINDLKVINMFDFNDIGNSENKICCSSYRLIGFINRKIKNQLWGVAHNWFLI